MRHGWRVGCSDGQVSNDQEQGLSWQLRWRMSISVSRCFNMFQQLTSDMVGVLDAVGKQWREARNRPWPSNHYDACKYPNFILFSWCFKEPSKCVLSEWTQFSVKVNCQIVERKRLWHWMETWYCCSVMTLWKRRGDDSNLVLRHNLRAS